MKEIHMTFTEFKRKCVTNDNILTDKLIVISSKGITKYFEWVGIGLIEIKAPNLNKDKIIIKED